MDRLIRRWRRACNERDLLLRPGETEGFSFLVVGGHDRGLLVLVVLDRLASMEARVTLEGYCLNGAVCVVRWLEVAARSMVFGATRGH